MNKTIKKIFPFLNWIDEIREPKIFRADVVAGISVALLLVPQSMAFAQLADLPPYYGLYAAFIPPAIAALFGSSRQLAAGPVATASLITAATLQSLAAPGTKEYFAYAIALALIIGIIRLIIGFCKLGVVTNFLSFPVVAGFTNAVALMIFCSQIPNAFGVQSAKNSVYILRVWNSIKEIFIHFNLWTTLMFFLALAVLIIARKFSKKMPAIIFAVIVTTIIAWKFGYNGAIVGKIPAGLPKFQLPVFDLRALPTLFLGAITITLVGLMEVISIAKTVAAKTHQHIDVNQEIIGQGMASFVGSFFQSYPVSSSFSRTAVNYKSGARTGFASVVTSIMVGLTLMFLTPIFYYLPKATLAAAIMFSIVTFINFRPFIETWKVNKYDSVICATTFLLTLAFAPRLYVPILIGVLLSVIFYLYRSFKIKNENENAESEINTDEYENLSIITLDSKLYFLNCAKFEDKIFQIILEKNEIEYLILDARKINYIDASGVNVMKIIIDRLIEAGIDVYFTNMNARVFRMFKRANLCEKIGDDHFIENTSAALKKIRQIED